jgi:hypothetical protein
MMRYLRTPEQRELYAEVMLSPNSYNEEHLELTLKNIQSQPNFNTLMRDYGADGYDRLIRAFQLGSHRLKTQGVIEPNDFEIICAWMSKPRRYGFQQDDGVDFKTPFERIKAALKLPINLKDLVYLGMNGEEISKEEYNRLIAKQDAERKAKRQREFSYVG